MNFREMTIQQKIDFALDTPGLISKEDILHLLGAISSADELAKTAEWVLEGNRQPPDWDDLQDALAAYEKSRGKG